jgi:5,10-methylenetetrahydromethanopterin reductase
MQTKKPISQTRHLEFGVVMEPSPGYTARLAAEIEAMGFDALLCPDTQCLSPEPYGQLSLAAARTTRLRLGTGVTNPITRDSSVTAGALATLQVESGGRAICGIGRGDSSAAHIGRRNAKTAELREYVEQVRGYLRGEEVQRGETVSRMRWLQGAALPPVPIDIACTGPATIRMAADVADRITFAVGSAPERIRWALETLHAHLRETGRKRDSLSVGAFVNLVCDADERRAIDLGRMISGMVAHFAGMKDSPVEHLPPRLKDIAVRMKSGYDMARHAQNEGAHLAVIDDEFVDWFSICGPPAKCRERLGELISMGLDHVYLLGGSPVPHPHGARQEAMVRQSRLFAEQVMPALRR